MDLTGRTIRHFTVLSRLGAGGMGEVWLADDSQLRRRVAIKIMRSDALGSSGAQRRFFREARAAAALNHPNVCPIYEIDELDGETFIVLQYVEGKTLAAMLRQRGPLPPQRCAASARRLVTRNGPPASKRDIFLSPKGRLLR